MVICCKECGQPFPMSQDRCPHCGRPSLFPNVAAAAKRDEIDALEHRYEQACGVVAANKSNSVRRQFEAAIESDSKVVISTSFNELERLAQADTNVFSTFYSRVQASLQIPTGDKWDVLRRVAEDSLFPGYKDRIRFGVLSLDGVGVKNYGQCSMQIKHSMVTHRTSLFEDNNVVFTVYEQKMKMADAESPEPGHRATWAARHKLCVAKLAPKLRTGLTAQSFPNLLLEQGRTTRDDRFIELHIWGSLTIRSVQRVRVHCQQRRPLKAVIRDVQRLLEAYSVDVETD